MIAIALFFLSKHMDVYIGMNGFVYAYNSSSLFYRSR